MKELTQPESLVRAVVIDSDPRWRQAVTAALVRAGVTVMVTSGDLNRAPELLDAYPAELLLVGVDNEIDNRQLYCLLRRVDKRYPEIVTIVFVADQDRVTVDAALAGGAYWAVDRRLGAAQIVRAVIDAYRAQLKTTSRRASAAGREPLTGRELEILRLVAEGRANREVAKILWVTDQTIKFHLQNIYGKLGVRNRIEASHWAIARGLVRPRPDFDDDPDGEPGSGVREPRRPIGPSQSGGIALEPGDPADSPDELGGSSSDARGRAA
jgi:two-component system, NarL family, response regulator